jgi:hypothetical protein
VGKRQAQLRWICRTRQRQKPVFKQKAHLREQEPASSESSRSDPTLKTNAQSQEHRPASSSCRSRGHAEIKTRQETMSSNRWRTCEAVTQRAVEGRDHAWRRGWVEAQVVKRQWVQPTLFARIRRRQQTCSRASQRTVHRPGPEIEPETRDPLVETGFWLGARPPNPRACSGLSEPLKPEMLIARELDPANQQHGPDPRAHA